MKDNIFVVGKKYRRRGDEKKRPVEWHQWTNGDVSYGYSAQYVTVYRDGNHPLNSNFDLLPCPEYEPYSAKDLIDMLGQTVACHALGVEGDYDVERVLVKIGGCVEVMLSCGTSSYWVGASGLLDKCNHADGRPCGKESQ